MSNVQQPGVQQPGPMAIPNDPLAGNMDFSSFESAGDPLTGADPLSNQAFGTQQSPMMSQPGQTQGWGQPSAPAKKSNKGLIIGIASGGGVLLCVLIIAIVYMFSSSGDAPAVNETGGSGSNSVTTLAFDDSGEVSRPPNPGTVISDEQSRKNLRQITLAHFNHEDENREFLPAYSTDSEGKPLLSWRVHLLPYFGLRDSPERRESAQLYKEFKLDEPWDSEHNKKLISRMPEVYKVSNNYGQVGLTHYAGARGEGTTFSGEKGVTLGEMLDGTSNTICMLEVSHERAVCWTQPEDYSFDPQDPKTGLIGLRNGGFLCSVSDSSVFKISDKIPNDSLVALFQIADKRRVSASDFQVP